MAGQRFQVYSPKIMDLSLFGIFIAFLGGVISFLSPCVLPLVPGYVSYIAGGSLEDLTEDPSASRRMQAIYLSLFFRNASALPIHNLASCYSSCKWKDIHHGGIQDCDGSIPRGGQHRSTVHC